MKIDAFKNILKEIVREVIQEELNPIIGKLNEMIEKDNNKLINQNSFKNTFKPNKTVKEIEEEISPTSVIQSLLFETSKNMNPEEYKTMRNLNMTTNDLPVNMPIPASIDPQNVDLSNIPSPNVVPDFTELMSKLKEKNKI